MSTRIIKQEDAGRKWHLVNLEGKALGRAASEIAKVLRGKNKPCFATNVDTGDFVVVVNVEKVLLTGKKLTDKKYYRHSGYPGGLKVFTADRMLERKPEELIIRAVKGMLPKNKLGRQMLGKMKVYVGNDHPHAAQQPQVLEF
ncbi:MAG: 50S ribosomal protein L13 [Deltaproteobacteria bacterium]|nr:50S ribosomal protein L13 [Deltaproteobacteria bacterium]